MSITTRRVWILAAAVAAASSSSALADHNTQLETTLSGPVLNGATPFGRARVDQQRLPGKFEVRVDNLNLSNGTRADVFLGGELVGSAAVSDRRVELRTTRASFVPQFTVVEVKVGATTVASGTLRAR
jgi:hypothetical protein